LAEKEENLNQGFPRKEGKWGIKKEKIVKNEKQSANSH